MTTALSLPSPACPLPGIVRRRSTRNPSPRRSVAHRLVCSAFDSAANDDDRFHATRVLLIQPLRGQTTPHADKLVERGATAPLGGNRTQLTIGANSYTTPDPLGLEGGSYSLYGYVGGDPVSYMDPYGLWEMYGNWGGRDWSGGKAGPRIPPNPSPPTDSMDACFMQHDYCFQSNEDNSACRDSSYPSKKVESACNAALVQCLERLPRNTSEWPLPPKTSPKNPLTRGNLHDPVADDFRAKATFFFRK